LLSLALNLGSSDAVHGILDFFRGDERLSGESVTTLILLLASAWTRIVSTNLRHRYYWAIAKTFVFGTDDEYASTT
jgi:hypothetical protein